MIAAITTLFLGACSASDDAHDAGMGGDILTIYGNILTVDRGPIEADVEPLFGAFGIDFDAACVLPWASLAALEQHTVQVDFPAGGAVRSYSGPLLRDVLAIAGPTSDLLVVTALDGYQREIDLQRVQDHDVILAIRMNGDSLPIGGLGPAFLVWPRRTDPALADMPDDDWVWGVFAIQVVDSPEG